MAEVTERSRRSVPIVVAIKRMVQMGFGSGRGSCSFDRVVRFIQHPHLTDTASGP